MPRSHSVREDRGGHQEASRRARDGGAIDMASGWAALPNHVSTEERVVSYDKALSKGLIKSSDVPKGIMAAIREMWLRDREG